MSGDHNMYQKPRSYDDDTPTMDDAIAAGDSVLMNEQAALLRECRMALDHLLRDKPMLAAKVCGTTTLGNLRAMLYEYRPQGVFGRHEMNREDIIKLARGAGFASPDGLFITWGASDEQLERFAALIAATEREACAAVCCDMIDAEYNTGKVDHNEMAWTQACAIAIRARRNA